MKVIQTTTGTIKKYPLLLFCKVSPDASGALSSEEPTHDKARNHELLLKGQGDWRAIRKQFRLAFPPFPYSSRLARSAAISAANRFTGLSSDGFVPGVAWSG